MRRHAYRYTTLWTEDDDDVVFVTYAVNLEIDEDIAYELVENRKEFTQAEKHYLLIDFTNVRSVTKEARFYMNDPKGGLIGVLGGAFLSNSKVSTMFINLYLRINRPVIPAKFFTDRTDAIHWLKRIKLERSLWEDTQDLHK